MSYTPSMFTMPMVNLGESVLEKHHAEWAKNANRWNQLDRIYSNESQIVSLVEILETTKYLSSDTLLHPSIPEFTVVCEEPHTKANTYICYRKSLLTENDIPAEDIAGVIRRFIPVVDAYVYINNGGTRCNYIVTLYKCLLEAGDRRNTSTCQMITCVSDDPISKKYATYDTQYIAEFNRTIKMFYLAVQMVSMERPEIVCVGRTAIEATTSPKKGKAKRKSAVRMIKTIRFPSCTVSALKDKFKQEAIKITCPCWGVAGHWRTYQRSGKKVWIAPYRKGKERHNPNAYQAKEYIIPTH